MANELELIGVLAKRLRDLHRSFKTLSKQAGPQGEQGERGEPGVNGKQGERGPIGPRGPAGPKGDKGERGQKGERGPAGEKGERGPIPEHQWKGTKLRFQQADGKWGALVDLKGDSGSSGGVVVMGGGSDQSTGGSTWNPDSLPEAGANIPTEFVVKQDGQWVRASYDQMVAWVNNYNLDGGAASSVFLPDQTVNGGGANG